LLGKYQIIGVLKRSAIGIKYRAYDSQLHRYVALKVASEKEVENKTSQYFLEYARAQAKLNHPHIENVLELGAVQGVPFLALDLPDGESLKEILLRYGTLTLPHCLSIFAPIASALDYAHSKGIVHGFLDSRRVIIERSGAPLLIDFSLRTQISVEINPNILSPSNDQLLNQVQDRYVFFEMAHRALFGEIAFGDYLKNRNETFNRIQILFETALHADHKKRYGTCRALMDAIKREIELEEELYNKGSSVVKGIYSNISRKLASYNLKIVRKKDLNLFNRICFFAIILLILSLLIIFSAWLAEQIKPFLYDLK
jgi:hypothetical protein